MFQRYELRHERIRHGLELPDEHRIEERPEGSRIGNRRTACDHHRLIVASILPARVDSPQVQDVQQVGQSELVADGKADQVEITQRRSAFQATERQAVRPQLRLEIPGGGENPLAGHTVQCVELLVQVADGQIGHADLVQIGVGDGNAQQTGRILAHDPVLAARVAAGFLHGEKNPV